MIRNKAIARTTVGNAQDQILDHEGVVTGPDPLHGLFDQFVTDAIHYAYCRNEVEDPPKGAFAKIQQHKSH